MSELHYSIAWQVITFLEIYYLPVLVVLGSLGNCLSVYVVFASKMRRTSSSFYLAALAVSDTGFLASIFVAWLGLSWTNVQIMNKQGFCQFFVYLTNVCSFLSAWFVVAFTLERFVAVCYPLHRQWICTVNRAKLLLSGVTFAGLVLCSPVLVYSGPRLMDNTTREQCHIEEGWDSVASAVNYLDTILTFALPFCIIFVLNSLIVKTVWRVDSVRTSLKACGSTRDSPQPIHQSKVTKMLLIVSSVFFCLNLPAYAMRAYAFLQPDNSATELEVLIQRACNLLFNTNFGISFGLYCASGQNFRLAVQHLFSCRKHATSSSLSKRSSTVQQGTDTIRIIGTSSVAEQTIVINKPWKDSFRLRNYSCHRGSPQREQQNKDNSYCVTKPKKDPYDVRL
ncbi:thyrotropin-releasing hormone receptor [Phymastichus coffea]|uniref:thyrotropin-releasing hormone receptor n=1 Tax=Phymastichus coffea TaxID=108790 RepID=UPI00273CF036|nr:thyrotropin-releasing hormone receptor [Phymastichus coffea]